MRTPLGAGRRHRRPPTTMAAVTAVLLLVASCASAEPGGDRTPPGSAATTSRDAATESAFLDEVDVPTLTWTDCQDGVQCATAAVPLDYDEPRGDQIELALVRLPATDPEARIGSLFTNPGGPGGSGIGFVRNVAAGTFPEEVRARFDVIGLDPRGVAGSTPVTCFEPEEAEARTVLLDSITGWPTDAEDESAFVEATKDVATRCADGAGELLDHVSTADAARDLEMLRRAVGDEQLTYHGLSYGTYLGATYAALFPDEVGRLVLDGVLEPTAFAGAGSPADSLPWLRVGNDRATSQVLDQFFVLCRDAGEACPLGIGEDPEDRFAELVDALDAAPLDVGNEEFGEFLIRGDTVALETLTDLSAPSAWAGRSEVLAELHRLLVEEQDRAAAADYYLQVRAQVAEQAPVPGPDAPAPNDLEAYLSVLCADTQNPTSIKDVAAGAEAAREQAPYGAQRWAWVAAACVSWEGEAADAYTGPFLPTDTPPLLVVGTRHDPNTAYASAESFAASLPDAGLLTLEGWAHTASFQGLSSCIDDAVAAYLIEGVMPQDGTTCAPDPSAVPFASAD